MTLEISTHKNILLKILIDIYSNSSISPFLGFKGGTAAYLFYQLNRFSVDLDFDLLDSEKESIVLESLKTILSRHGVVKKIDLKRYNLVFILDYKDKKSGNQNIKIEINRRVFGSKYLLKSYMGIPMLVMGQGDMFAHKLLAMYESMGKTNRDIFDVWFFAKNNWSVNKEIVELRSGVKYKDFINQCIKSLDKFDDNDILSGIGELLDEKQKAWLKQNLIKETMIFLRLLIESPN